MVLKSYKAHKLKKASYGLKQAPRMWNQTLVKFLNSINPKQMKIDMRIFTNKSLIVPIYVDNGKKSSLKILNVAISIIYPQYKMPLNLQTFGPWWT